MAKIFTNASFCSHTLISDFVGDTDWLAAYFDVDNHVKRTNPQPLDICDGVLNLASDDLFQQLISNGASAILARVVDVAGAHPSTWADTLPDADPVGESVQNRALRAGQEHVDTWTSAVEGEDQSIWAGYHANLVPFTAGDGRTLYLDVVLIPLLDGSMADASCRRSAVTAYSNYSDGNVGVHGHQVRYLGRAANGYDHLVERKTVVEYRYNQGFDGTGPLTVYEDGVTIGSAATQTFCLLGVIADEKGCVVTNVPEPRYSSLPTLPSSGAVVDTPVRKYPVRPMLQVTGGVSMELATVLDEWATLWQTRITGQPGGDLFYELSSHIDRVQSAFDACAEMISGGVSDPFTGQPEPRLSYAFTGFVAPMLNTAGAYPRYFDTISYSESLVSAARFGLVAFDLSNAEVCALDLSYSGNRAISTASSGHNTYSLQAGDKVATHIVTRRYYSGENEVATGWWTLTNSFDKTHVGTDTAIAPFSGIFGSRPHDTFTLLGAFPSPQLESTFDLDALTLQSTGDDAVDAGQAASDIITQLHALEDRADPYNNDPVLLLGVARYHYGAF